MNDPRPRMTSARPPDTAFSVENRWNTRTGSSVDSTVTAVPRRMRFGPPAIAASTISGEEIAKSGRVMFPKTDEIDAQLVRQHRLLHHVAQDLVHALEAPVRADSHIAERI